MSSVCDSIIVSNSSIHETCLGRLVHVVSLWCTQPALISVLCTYVGMHNIIVHIGSAQIHTHTHTNTYTHHMCVHTHTFTGFLQYFNVSGHIEEDSNSSKETDRLHVVCIFCKVMF